MLVEYWEASDLSITRCFDSGVKCKDAPSIATGRSLAGTGRHAVHFRRRVVLPGRTIRYERIVHFVCHAVLYAGMALVAFAAVLRWEDLGKNRDAEYMSERPATDCINPASRP